MTETVNKKSHILQNKTSDEFNQRVVYRGFGTHLATDLNYNNIFVGFSAINANKKTTTREVKLETVSA